MAAARDNTKWKIAKVAGKGNGLLTTTNINAGEPILHVSSPLIALPTNEWMGDKCSGCFEQQSAVKTNLCVCAGCKLEAYCGRDCQRYCWRNGHKQLCPILAKLSKEGKMLPTITRAAMVLFWWLRKLRAEEAPISETKRLYDGLMTHIDEEIGADEKVGFGVGEVPMPLELEVRMVASLTGARDSAISIVRDAICKLRVNSFSLTDPRQEGEIGILFDPLLAIANHSCIPNAYITTSGREAAIRSMRSIQTDEEICLSYIDPFAPLQDRQRNLSRFHFECTCPKCRSDLDIYAVFLTTTSPESLENDIGRHLWDYKGMHEFARETANLPELPQNLPLRLEVRDLHDDIPRENQPYLRQSGLQKHKRIACSPFVDALATTAEYYTSGQRNIGAAAILLCGKMSLVQSYQFPEHTHPTKISAYVALARMLRFAFGEDEGPNSVRQLLTQFPTLERELIEELSHPFILFQTQLVFMNLAQTYVPFSHGASSMFAKMVNDDIEELMTEWKAFTREPSPIPRHMIIDFEQLKGDTPMVRATLERVRRLGSFENVWKVLMM